MKIKSVTLDSFEINLTGDSDCLADCAMQASELEDKLFLLDIDVSFKRSLKKKEMSLDWKFPISDAHVNWRSQFNGRGFIPDWAPCFTSKGASQAPVLSLFNYAGSNRLTFAFSDVINPVSYGAKVVEEEAIFICEINFSDALKPEIEKYSASILIDLREIPYYESLKRVSSWWEDMPHLIPAHVPEEARLPVYSTWYSFHQDTDPKGIEKQCALAKKLGCESVIVDDGWQTDDMNRGYAYCGDWKVAENKIPDMAAHVAEVHKTGMKYILWYAVPYAGKHSEAAKRFEGKFLSYNERLETYVLDPRFPDVREYLISIYENAVLEYDLDGFKLDFVDAFVSRGEALSVDVQGKDFESVEKAVDKLMSDIVAKLKKRKPDMLFEFRQSYIGPAMRKYGNMFRAGDVPNDSLSNRMRVLDIRLLSGNTPAHSDMLMWHRKDPVQSAALQIANVIFSVPQISVKLDELPAEHIAMISFYLDFWRKNRDVLLDGKLMPLHPEDSYPVALSETESKFLAVSYAPFVIPISLSGDKNIMLLNGSRDNQIYYEFNGEESTRNMKVYDCMGNLVFEKEALLKNGVFRLDVPSAGMAVLLF